jgi:hypothetical protein
MSRRRFENVAKSSKGGRHAKAAWAVFRDARRNRTLPEVVAELEALQREIEVNPPAVPSAGAQARNDPVLVRPPRPRAARARRRRRRSAVVDTPQRTRCVLLLPCWHGEKARKPLTPKDNTVVLAAPREGDNRGLHLTRGGKGEGPVKNIGRSY